MDGGGNINKEDENEEDKDEELSSKEKVVRSAFPDASIRKIRRLLIRHKGDPDKVIDAMYELKHKDTHNEPVKVDTTTAAIPDEASTLLQIPEEIILMDEPEQTRQTATINDSNPTNEPVHQDIPDEKLPDVSKEEEGSQEQQEEPSGAPPIKPKKLSAAERKKEQKKRQKENKLIKDRAKAARKAGYKQQAKLQDNQEQNSSSEIAAAASQSMKEMYI